MSLTFNNKTTGAIRTLKYNAKVPFAFTSSTGLDANQIYTSGWSDAADFDVVRGLVFISGSEVGETIGGTFELQQSFNTGSEIELTSSLYTVGNDIGVPFSETLYTRYVRLEYTNNAASGSAFNTGSFIAQGYLIG
jgi:hypothetical protein